ncbi:flavin-containing superfamily amine oxidase [Nemania abortiva]|nr:flavin-containing superfamily amine oxidase [Nemania abortiva]
MSLISITGNRFRSTSPTFERLVDQTSGGLLDARAIRHDSRLSDWSYPPLTMSATTMPIVAPPIESIVISDVTIVGGGASGTYAAIRLTQAGKTVTLVEQQDRLGGHVSTHRVSTGETIDYGVISYEDTTVVQNFFRHVGVPLTTRATAKNFRNTTVHANLQSDGRVVTLDDSIPWARKLRMFEALKAFRTQVALYPFLDNGLQLPSTIPSDLLLPFGDFVRKYSLEPMLEFVFIWMGGLPRILQQITLYIMKSLSLRTVDALIGSGPAHLTTARENNQELYDKSLEKLSGSVFLQSTVEFVSRDEEGVNVVASTPSGRVYIKSKKLVLAIPPLTATYERLGMDLTSQEKESFGCFTHGFYRVMLIRDSGLPDDHSFTTVDAIEPTAHPGLFYVAATGISGYHIAYHSSACRLSDESVKTETLEGISRVARANGYFSDHTAEIVAFRDHSPYLLGVSAELIQDGFYERLNSLQGQMNTYWTGAAWQAQDSSLIWDWTEKSLLPRIIASL